MNTENILPSTLFITVRLFITELQFTKKNVLTPKLMNYFPLLQITVNFRIYFI